jgi:RNA-binding protein Nova
MADQMAPAIQVDGSVPAVSSQETECTLKILVSHNAAGSLIGKQGATIIALQQQSNARIKLSQSQEFFPGTYDRVVMMTGNLQAVEHGAMLILQKIKEDTEAHQQRLNANADGTNTTPPSDTIQVKLAVPSRAAGLIIGKGGENVKHIMELTGSRVQLSSKDAIHGLSERLTTISGTFEQTFGAVRHILHKMQEDEIYRAYQNNSTSYLQFANGSSRMGGMPQGMPQAGGGMQQSPYGAPPPQYGAPQPPPPAPMGFHNAPMTPAGGVGVVGDNSMITFSVPDAQVGAIVGKGGQQILELQQVTRTRIKISQRKEFAPGTTNRIVQISGRPQDCQAAQVIIHQKISAMSDPYGAMQQQGMQQQGMQQGMQYS